MVRHPIARGYVHGLWGQVHYRRCGEGSTVLLLHQTSVSGRMFEAGMPALAAQGFSTIAFDAPGYGQLDPPDGVPSMKDYADNLALVLNALGLARPHMLGHNTGAGIASIHAARTPADWTG